MYLYLLTTQCSNPYVIKYHRYHTAACLTISLVDAYLNVLLASDITLQTFMNYILNRKRQLY